MDTHGYAIRAALQELLLIGWLLVCLHTGYAPLRVVASVGAALSALSFLQLAYLAGKRFLDERAK